MHVQEVDSIAIGQAAGRGFLGAALLGRDAADRRLFDQRLRVERIVGSDVHHAPPSTELNWKIGRYRAITMAAITTPMNTSIAGSISVTNRATSVSISSS